MRNATILMVWLKGVATEAVKNIVLAGIGKLIVLDAEDVAAEDLGAGFFFRDEDVGKKVSVALTLSSPVPAFLAAVCRGSYGRIFVLCLSELSLVSSHSCGVELVPWLGPHSILPADWTVILPPCESVHRMF